MNEIVRILYVFLPAGIANATPPVLTRVLGAGRAVDGGVTLRGQPLFGQHKTWQGLIGGTAAGTLAFVMQRAFDGFEIPLIAGVAMSAGALLGDLVKSFFKRRLAVRPGKSWIPFDQLDYVTGAMLLASPFIRLSLRDVLAIVAVYFGGHIIVSVTGYLLHIKTDIL